MYNLEYDERHCFSFFFYKVSKYFYKVSKMKIFGMGVGGSKLEHVRGGGPRGWS